MAQEETQSIPQAQFLTMSANLLHRAFIESTRTDAKSLFKQLAEGTRVALTRVEMEDKSLVRFDLSLDHSEYRGKLNYGGFRNSLGTLIANLSTALQKEQEISSFTAQDQPGKMMFGVTGVTVEEEQPNVMVLGADVTGGQANVVLQLMYVDPEQFANNNDGPRQQA